MSVDSASTVNITIEYAPDAIDASAFNGVTIPPHLRIMHFRPLFILLQLHGAIRRALLAKANTDMDR